MGVSRQLKQYVGRRMARRLSRSMPLIGGAIALIGLGAAMRRKGWLGGALDTALDLVPFVGGLKNTAEAVRGRDYIPDRPTAG